MLEGGGNVLPKNLVDELPEECDSAHGEDTDERGQEGVFQQVLTVVRISKSAHRFRDQLRYPFATHMHTPSLLGLRPVRSPGA